MQTITLIKTDAATDFWATIEITIESSIKVIDGGSKTTAYSLTETTTVNKGDAVFCATTEKKPLAKGYTGEMATAEAMHLAAKRCAEMGYAVA
jgi:hypothetical protein